MIKTEVEFEPSTSLNLLTWDNCLLIHYGIKLNSVFDLLCHIGCHEKKDTFSLENLKLCANIQEVSDVLYYFNTP